MPRLTGIGRVLVPVGDQDEAIAFFLRDNSGNQLMVAQPRQGRPS
jgi:hypothetical protein